MGRVDRFDQRKRHTGNNINRNDTYLSEGRDWDGGDPGFLSETGWCFLKIINEKTLEKWCSSAFKADHTTSKRIRYEFITVKSTTLIGLNSPRKNATLPAIKCIEPRRPTFFTNFCFL
ncbi:hypothetical protein TNCV_2852851 [Trichonephila clavipes]|uniref:Uncharacterized protein n=1 Tax=Trichonephila clavipes TaxID=2585209 RepID=A0A8X6R6F6_TRICX|nr:hypothetical protein TNCV_2852851 [Trichonephila clavipes]